MAHARNTNNWSNQNNPKSGDWNALRSDLKNLLDQVEGQVALAQTPIEQTFDEPRREFSRHHQQQQPQQQQMQQPLMPQPLERYSNEGRQNEQQGNNPNGAYTEQNNQDEQNYNQVSSALLHISNRLEQFENNLEQKLQKPEQVNNVAPNSISANPSPIDANHTNSNHTDESLNKITDQLSQLTQVVELLSGAVGESGQVKRLETQIEKIIALVSDAPKTDLSDVSAQVSSKVSAQISALGNNVEQLAKMQARSSKTQEQLAQELTNNDTNDFSNEFLNIANRIDLLVKNIEQLGEIQERNANALTEQKPDTGFKEFSENYESGLNSISLSVGNIYDRLDQIEKSSSLSPIDIERLFQEMGEITSQTAIISQKIDNGQTENKDNDLVDRIDILNDRLALIENTDVNVGEVNTDFINLRELIKDAIEPRFHNLQTRIEQLSNNIEGGGEKTSSIERLDVQIAQLIAVIEQNSNPVSSNISGGQDYSTNNNLDNIHNEANKSHQSNEEPQNDVQSAVEQINARFNNLTSQSNSTDNHTKTQSDRLDEKLLALKNSFDNNDKKSEFEISETIPQVSTKAEPEYIEPENVEPKYIEPAPQSPAPEQAIQIKQEPKPKPKPEQKETQVYNYQAPREKKPQNNPTISEADMFASESENDKEGRSLPLALQEQAKKTSDNISQTSKPKNPQMGVNDALKELAKRHNKEQAQVNKPKEKTPQRQPSDKILLQVKQPNQISSNLPKVKLPINEEKAPSVSSTGFNPQNAERPSMPASDFAPSPQSAYEDVKKNPQTQLNSDLSNNLTNTSSKNTFIEAARRAANRQNAEPVVSEPNSLMGRAFARFQKPKSDSNKNKTDDALDQNKKPSRAEKKAMEKAFKEAKKNSQEQTEQVNQESSNGQESLVDRYKKPVIISLALVIIIGFSINLIIGRSDNQSQTNLSSKTTSTNPLTSDPQTLRDITPAVTPTATSPVTSNPEPKPTVNLNPTTPTPVKAPAPTTNINSAPDIIATGSVDQNNSTNNNESNVKEQAIPREIDLSQAGQIDESISTGSISNTKISTVNAIKLEMPKIAVGPIELREAAAKGSPQAQFEVGAIYSEGKTLEQDFTSAAIWYERAAAQGFAPAGYRLGGLYEKGQGVEKNLELARLWYQRAAEAGNRMAMHNLASLYAGSEMDEQDFTSALEWFERAAKHDLVDSQFNLGMLYARGLGTEQDLKTAYLWFAIAAKNGDKDAQKAQTDIARSLDSASVSELQTQAANWQSQKMDIRANFAPIGTWADSFNPGKTISNKNVVKRVQSILFALGYDVGTPDGLMGPRTSQAIKEFENEAGMKPSGQINPRLLAVLGSQPV